MRKLLIIILLLNVGLLNMAWSQAREIPAEELAQYEKQAKQLIRFLEYTFNTLGDPGTDFKQKETIINQSYLKSFRDSKVQVEDDLDAGREIAIRKDVQAYLKDIDFFFNKVEFKFEVDEVTHGVNDSGVVYFTARMLSKVYGINVKGDTLNSTQMRFVEINLNEAAKEMKIASIYTTLPDETLELQQWWTGLSLVWKQVFLPTATATDAITDEQLKRIIEMKELNISGKQNLETMEPLSRLRNLTLLNISNTGISDITPLRNLSKLQTLFAADNMIKVIDPLKYSTNLIYVDLSNTQVENVDLLASAAKLTELNLAGTNVTDVSVLSRNTSLTWLSLAKSSFKNPEKLSKLVSLKELDLTNTRISDISALKSLVNLEMLSISRTDVTSLAGLANLPKLNTLKLNNTKVSDLFDLVSAKSLKSLYCDGTPITKEHANDFMMTNRNVLIVFEIEVLRAWWQKLPVEWRNYFNQELKIKNTPTDEQLNLLASMEVVNISGKTQIKSLEPLAIFTRLKTLDLSRTGVSSLKPLSVLRFISEINFSNSSVESLEGIENLVLLQRISANRTRVSSLDLLSKLTALQYASFDSCLVRKLPLLDELQQLQWMYVDGNDINNDDAVLFARQHANTQLIWNTQKLLAWWNSLDNNWRNLIMMYVKPDATPKREQLHEIWQIRKLNINNASNISSLNPITQLNLITDLTITGFAPANFEALAKLTGMEKLSLERMSVNQISFISAMKGLKVLSLQHTAVKDLAPLAGISTLEHLNVAGTKVGSLSPLSGLQNLTFVAVNSSKVKSLGPLKKLKNLQRVECYNNGMFLKMSVGGFKKALPNCNVLHW